MRPKPTPKKSKIGFDKDIRKEHYRDWEIVWYTFIPNHFSVFNKTTGRELWDAGFKSIEEAKLAIDDIY